MRVLEDLLAKKGSSVRKPPAAPQVVGRIVLQDAGNMKSKINFVSFIKYICLI